MGDERLEAVERAQRFLADQWYLGRSSSGERGGPDIDRILEAIISPTWRKTKIDRVSLDDTRKKISDAMDRKEALQFSVPFGGYKAWTLATNPHLNWADVFAVNYMRRHGVRISRFMPHGVTFVLTYCSGVLNLVNNLPLSWQEQYLSELRTVLFHFSDDAVQFQLFDIASLFDDAAAVRKALEAGYRVVMEQWPNLPELSREKRMASARRNLVVIGVENLEHVAKTAFENRVLYSAMMCEALDSLRERRDFNKFSTRIQLVHVRGPSPPCIHVGSCDTSANHFGMGFGAVEVRPNRILQRIATTKTELSRLPGIEMEEISAIDSMSNKYPGLNVCTMIRYKSM